MTSKFIANDIDDETDVLPKQDSAKLFRKIPRLDLQESFVDKDSFDPDLHHVADQSVTKSRAR